MYKKFKIKNNNIKESDIIKTLEKMMAFAGGMGMGIMYQKYKKNIMSYINKMTRNM
jgi:hypothetical protein